MRIKYSALQQMQPVKYDAYTEHTHYCRTQLHVWEHFGPCDEPPEVLCPACEQEELESAVCKEVDDDVS